MIAAILFGVVITITQEPIPIVCPSLPSTITKAVDGTYFWPQMTTATLQLCQIPGSRWQEEWTDYPEKGGKFIQRLPLPIEEKK